MNTGPGTEPRECAAKGATEKVRNPDYLPLPSIGEHSHRRAQTRLGPKGAPKHWCSRSLKIGVYKVIGVGQLAPLPAMCEPRVPPFVPPVGIKGNSESSQAFELW